MSRHHDKRKKKKLAKHDHKIAGEIKRLEHYNRILHYFGCQGLLNQLPSKIKSDILSITCPAILVDTEDCKQIFTIENIKDAILREYNSTKITDHLYLHDICRMGCLRLCLSQVANKLNLCRYRYSNKLDDNDFYIISNSVNICSQINDMLKEGIKRYYPEFSEQLSLILYRNTLKHFTFNHPSIKPVIDLAKTGTGKHYIKVKLLIIKPVSSTISVSGKNRKAYLCQAINMDEMPPIYLDVGVIDNHKKLPIYIQEHAIARLAERLDSCNNNFIYDHVCRSLMQPVVRGKSKDCYLIEYRYFDIKLGYLIVSKQDNKALIRSFKFITMMGTPEFKALKNKLGGSQEDFAYLGLDKIQTLLSSDIKKDSKVLDIFKDCGLGHLFEACDSEEPSGSLATDIRNYFNIK